MNNSIFKFTFWKTIGVIIVAAGIYSTYIRFTQGLGAVTNLSDAFPWGLWIGFDILCGVGLAAGGFTICAVTHIFNIKRFKPLTRPAILTAFLGYLLVIVALLYDLGKPYNLWHAIIMWNPSSVMFEVAWCVMLYTTVLFLEFSLIALEKLRWLKVLNIMKKILVPLVILGIILSTLHQSSLGSLYLIVPTKMHPLWYSAYLPVYFFFSAVTVGFAMVTFESYLSARALNHGLKTSLLSEAGKVILVVLILNFAAKAIDFIVSGKISFLVVNTAETYLFYLELLIGTVIPVYVLSYTKYREDRKWQYISSIFVIAGFLLNRMNVSVTSMAASSGVSYFPSVNEISITLLIVVVGMWAFKLTAKYFPVFMEEHVEEETALTENKPIILSE